MSIFQVENEYGTEGCDAKYLTWLRNLVETHLGENVVLFTTDMPTKHQLDCGSFISGVHPTTDFGPGTLVQIGTGIV
jgi:beta-galactosidase